MNQQQLLLFCKIISKIPNVKRKQVFVFHTRPVPKSLKNINNLNLSISLIMIQIPHLVWLNFNTRTKLVATFPKVLITKTNKINIRLGICSKWNQKIKGKHSCKTQSNSHIGLILILVWQAKLHQRLQRLRNPRLKITISEVYLEHLKRSEKTVKVDSGHS
jgi:hypothetical protein